MKNIHIEKNSYTRIQSHQTQHTMQRKKFKTQLRIYMGDNSTFAASTALLTSSGVPLAILHITCREGKLVLTKESKRTSHIFS
jgi:hypothetical protein